MGTVVFSMRKGMALPAAVITLFIGCLYIGSELSRLEAFATESTLSAGSKLLTQKAEELQATLGSSTSVEGHPPSPRDWSDESASLLRDALTARCPRFGARFRALNHAGPYSASAV